MTIPGLDAAKLAIAPYLLWVKIGAAVILAGLIWWGVATVLGWREDSHALEATEKALVERKAELTQCTDRAVVAAQAYLAAAGKAESVAAADKATAQEIERELQTKLASADASGRDLARRLRDYQRTRAGCGAVSAPAGPAAVPGGASAESRLDEEIERAAEQVNVDCKLDAVELTGWQEWWEKVKANRVLATPPK